MRDPKAANELLKLTVDEVFASVTDDGSRHPETREDGVLEEALDSIHIRICTRSRLYPFGNVVHCHQDVLVPF